MTDYTVLNSSTIKIQYITVYDYDWETKALEVVVLGEPAKNLSLFIKTQKPNACYFVDFYTKQGVQLHRVAFCTKPLKEAETKAYGIDLQIGMHALYFIDDLLNA